MTAAKIKDDKKLFKILCYKESFSKFQSLTKIRFSNQIVG